VYSAVASRLIPISSLFEFVDDEWQPKRQAEEGERASAAEVG
jgi:hypothetical protein